MGVLKTEGIALGFQHSPRDLANVNEWKIMFDCYSGTVAVPLKTFLSLRCCKGAQWPSLPSG